MKITKTDAASVAEKMTDKQQKAIEKLQKELSEYAKQIALSHIKKEVMDAFKKFPQYFNTSSSINLTGNGLNYEYIGWEELLPYTGNRAKLPTVAQANTVISLLNRISDLKKTKIKLYSDIENALLSLGTYAKIQAEFKEVAPFLPFKQKSEIVVNLTDIRKRL